MCIQEKLGIQKFLLKASVQKSVLNFFAKVCKMLAYVIGFWIVNLSIFSKNDCFVMKTTIEKRKQNVFKNNKFSKKVSF